MHAWIKNSITHLLLIEDFFDNYKFNYVFWSIAVEWQIYFLFPLLLLLWRRRGGLLPAGAAMIVTFGIAFLTAGLADGSVSNPIASGRLARIVIAASARSQQIHIHYISLFAMGMLGAQLAFGPARLGIEPRRIPWRALSAASGATLLIICCLGIGVFLQHKLLDDFLAAVTTVGILIPASRGTRDSIRAALSARPLVWVGTFSYSLYLIHAPLLQVVWQYVINPLHLVGGPAFALLCLIGSPLIITAAYLFYYLCERPFLNSPPRPLPKPAA
jgi:peptidoglycan/LPS O-acetylase OafA/YrhL